MRDDEIDNRVEIGNLSLAKSYNCPGSIIYWDKKMSMFWIMIGFNGFEFCGDMDDKKNIYTIIGVDEI